MSPEWILNQFWVSSAWIQNEFWVRSEWILYEFWIRSEWVPNEFWMNSEWVLDGFYIGSGLVLNGVCMSSGLYLNDSWVGFNRVLHGFLMNSDGALVLIDDKFWMSSQWVLNEFGINLYWSWMASEWVPTGFCINSDVFLHQAVRVLCWDDCINPLCFDAFSLHFHR